MSENKDQFEDFKKEAKNSFDEFKKGANSMLNDASDAIENQKSKRIVAALCAFFLGTLGVHKFVLGYTKQGIITLILSAVTFGTLTQIIGLIESIVYITKSDEDFYTIYEVGERPWF